ncbi:MAG: D-tyrosyl-tRNA(Tyr) deacylase, partial [Muribaculaceae bacterium]|nr:D-tyrosyl-tRNA(Tyr) deacylase [Muribaculaceae bacterium]
MKLVIQRVKSASVSVAGELVSSIQSGLLVLVGVADTDTDQDLDYAVRKCVNLRIFNDDNGVMNRSVIDTCGDVLAVSQFTLLAATRKGNRPSYIHAAGHDLAVPMYDAFCDKVSELIGREVQKGIFGADMQVSLVNDGPVTIIIDS